MEIMRWFVDETLFHNLIGGIPSLGLFVLVIASLVVLVKGADWMIDGVVELARRTGMPRIVIGATIISLGTTTPEAFVSVMAAWMGNPGLALGNGVGSIIADTGLIFGTTCILVSVPMNRYILNRTGWVQVGAATLLVIVSVGAWIRLPENPMLYRWVGILFLGLLAWYLYATYRWTRQGGTECVDEDLTEEAETGSLGRSLIMVLGGLFLVVTSARILVPCAAAIAARVGVPNDIIAATMVAFGTSLPELMTAITSCRKGCPEVTVGNIVGADVLNCLFVIGAAAVAKPLFISPNFFLFHFPTMLIILYSFRLFIFMNRDNQFKMWQGVWLLGIYLIYVILQYALHFGTITG